MKKKVNTITIVIIILLCILVLLSLSKYYYNESYDETPVPTCRAGANCVTSPPPAPARDFDNSLYVCNRDLKVCSKLSKADGQPLLNSGAPYFKTNMHKMMNERKPEFDYEKRDFTLPPPQTTMRPDAVVCGYFPEKLPPLEQPMPNPTNAPVQMCVKPDNYGYPILSSYLRDVYMMPRAGNNFELTAYLMDSVDSPNSPVKTFRKSGF